MSAVYKKALADASVVMLLFFFMGLFSISPACAKSSAKDEKPAFAVKKWPDHPLRGINTVLVAPSKKNSIDPGGYLSEAFFKKLVEWNINVIRVTIGVDKNSVWYVEKGAAMPPIPVDNPLAPYQKHLLGLEVALAHAAKYDIKIILTAGNIAGRRIDVLYNEDDGGGYHTELIKIWAYVAQTHGSHPNLIGYDLLNEPVEKRGEMNWRYHILPDLIKVVRRYDPNTYLVIEAAPWGSSRGLKEFTPVDDKKVVYSFHFYSPHNYTHQGLRGISKGLSYPGMIKKSANSPLLFWDRNQMQKEMRGTLDFQQKYNARIIVGEFGVLRWSGGAEKWLSDAISLFEECGWDWCFHSYGGWNGWNPTFLPTDPQRNETDGGRETEMLKVLKNAWMKNSGIRQERSR